MLSLDQVNGTNIQYANRPSLATTSLTDCLIKGQNSKNKKNYVRLTRVVLILHLIVLQGHVNVFIPPHH
jgi:hypothetical protein